MPARKIKRYSKFYPTVREATALQQRIAAGTATDAEAQYFEKIMREFRRKFANGTLSPQSARQFGIE
jgi:hypothetical protein